jgi:hypothetical protein
LTTFFGNVFQLVNPVSEPLRMARMGSSSSCHYTAAFRTIFPKLATGTAVGLPRVHVSTPLSSLSRCTAGHVPSHGVLCARRPLGAHWCVTLEVEVAAVVI